MKFHIVEKNNIHLPKSWINRIDLSRSLAQENDCSSGSTCINSGSNNADIHVAQHHSYGSSSYKLRSFYNLKRSFFVFIILRKHLVLWHRIQILLTNSLPFSL
jgi:hypothetical protein